MKTQQERAITGPRLFSNLEKEVQAPVHASLVKLVAMTPGEYKNGGENLVIQYGFANSPFGAVLLASTQKGICYLAFYDGSKEDAFSELEKQFPHASYQARQDTVQQNALALFSHNWQQCNAINLHVKATAFQVKVWEALLRIPMGSLCSYASIAAGMQQPLASRAVGTAVGDNPVAFLIPCHRVIKSTGEFGQYHWGSLRKTAMIGWEAAKVYGKQ